MWKLVIYVLSFTLVISNSYRLATPAKFTSHIHSPTILYFSPSQIFLIHNVTLCNDRSYMTQQDESVLYCMYLEQNCKKKKNLKSKCCKSLIRWPFVLHVQYNENKRPCAVCRHERRIKLNLQILIKSVIQRQCVGSPACMHANILWW